jgi:single-strand DNA-binding protein
VANLNKVMLMGNLTRDPELTHTSGGTAICAFGMAMNRKWTSQSGEAKEEVTFVDVSAFGKQAETLAKYVQKGSPLFVEGRLKLDRWEAQRASNSWAGRSGMAPLPAEGLRPQPTPNLTPA